MLSSAAHPLIGISLEIRFGRPCIVGTRISVRDVLGWLGNGMGVTQIIEDFPELTATSIAAAQAYAADSQLTYADIFGRQPDFRVSYRVFGPEEGGRQMPAYQHIRWDFRYEDAAIHTGNWMVYPEFLDPDGQPTPNGPISPVGQATMYPLSGGPQDFHRQHIWPGVRGYFMEGSRRVGVCEVVNMLGLGQKAAAEPSGPANKRQ